MSTETSDPDLVGGIPRRRIVIASMVGTTIEFYDFYIYATAAVSVFPHPHGWRCLIWFRVRHASCSRPQRIGSGAFRLRRCRD